MKYTVLFVFLINVRYCLYYITLFWDNFISIWTTCGCKDQMASETS